MLAGIFTKNNVNQGVVLSHLLLTSLSQPQAFCARLLLIAFIKWLSFTPVVTQITSDAMFYTFNLSASFFTLIEEVWTDSHSGYKDRLQFR